MKIAWMTQGSFLIESGGVRILVDPYMSDCLEAKGVKRMQAYPLDLEELRPDMLLCTHDHLDHFDPETVERIASAYPDCVMAGPVSCHRHFLALGIAEKRCMLLERGMKVDFKGVEITAVHAAHSDPDAVGAVFAADGRRLYLSGDTLFSEELFNEHTTDCDLVLICINGRLGNMSLDEALVTVKKLKPAMALPMHYGLFAENTADPRPFIEGCQKSGIKSFEMKTGEFFTL